MTMEITAPNRAATRTIAECTTLAEALQTKDMLDRLRQAMPKHLSPERMLRVLVLAVSRTPELAKVPLREILGAMISLASLGLEPNTPLQHAWLIPFKKNRKKTTPNGRDEWVEETQVQVVIGYRGYIDLARRTGSLVSIHADVVYDGDEFSFEYGSRMHLRHVPGTKRGRPIYAYAHAKLTDGEAFEVLPYEEVLKIRDTSEGYQYALKQKNSPRDYLRNIFLRNPWVAYEHEMAAKTMVRRLSKMLPLSIEFATAAHLDASGDTGGVRWDGALDSAASPIDEVQVDDGPPAAVEHKPEAEVGPAVRQEREPVPVARGGEEMEVTIAPRETGAAPVREIEVVNLRMIPGKRVEDFLDFQNRFNALVETIDTVEGLEAVQRLHKEQLDAVRKNDIVRYDAIMERLIARRGSVEDAGAPASAK